MDQPRSCQHFIRFISTLVFIACLSTFVTAQHYWVGGSGSWSDASHWATTSGGDIFHDAPPTINDDAIFDANSFSSGGQTVTMDLNPGSCKSLIWTDVTNQPSFVSFAGTLLDVHGSVTFSPNMLTNLYRVKMKSTEAGNTITSAGTSFGENCFLQISGTGEFSLTDALTVNALQIFEGTFNSNSNAITCDFALETFQTRSKTINLGNSTVTSAILRVRGSNLTMNAQNAIINLDALYGDEDGNGPYHFGNVVLDHGGIIRGSCNFTTLTLQVENRSDEVRLDHGITLTADQFNISGTRRAPLILRSDSTGAESTLVQTAGTVTASYVVLQDIHASGGAQFNGDPVDDLGNNDGWNIISVTNADYYWVGNSGAWTDPAHWATTSGGNTMHTDRPGYFDNIIIDEKSVTESNVTIEIDTTFEVQSINCSGVQFFPRLYAPFTSNLWVFGSIDFPDSLDKDIYNTYLRGYKSHELTVGTGGRLINIGVWGEGTYDIRSDIECSNFTMYSGVINTNDHSFEVSNSFKQSNFRDEIEINLGASKIDARNFVIQNPETILNSGTAQIRVGGEFAGQGNSFNSLSLHGNSTVKGSNSFDTLTIDPGAIVTFQADSVQTIIERFNALGTPEAPISLASDITDSQTTLFKTSGNVNTTYVILQDMNATGGAAFNASQSIDNGNNSGWNITEIVPLTFYWVGGTGNWSDFNTHWATTSGGNEFHLHVPRPIDNVLFDASSFDTTGLIVTIDIEEVNFRDMIWTGVTNLPVLSGRGKTMNIYGSLILDDNMHSDVENFNFFADGQATIVPGRAGSPGQNSYFTFNSTGQWDLMDTLTVREIGLIEGTLNTNDHGVFVGFITYFEGTGTKELNLGTSNFDTRALTWQGTFGDNLTLNGEDSHIFCSSALTAHPAVAGASVINLNDVTFKSGNAFDVGSITMATSINTLTIAPGKQVEFAQGQPVSVNQLIAKGTVDEIITIKSTRDGEQGTIIQSEGVVDGEFLALQDISASGGATFNAVSSVDLGNVSGWTFFRQAQTIDFPEIDDRPEESDPFEISATSTSGLDVTFEIIAGLAELDGNTLTILGGGEIQVKASQTGNIEFDAAQSVINTFCAVPARPSITSDMADLPLLTSSRPEGNQWYSDGNLIAGATQQTYLATHSANYTVAVVSGGCSSEVSEDFVVTTTGVEIIDEGLIKIWPNPIVDNFLHLALELDVASVELAIFNMQGQQVHSSKYVNQNGSVLNIPIHQMANGTYVLHGKTDEGNFFERIVVQRD